MAAGSKQTTLTIAGDPTQLIKAFDKAGAAAKEMAGDLDKAQGDVRSFGSSVDNMNSKIDGSEGKFMGAADLLDGLGGAFGIPLEGATNMARSFADLAGGFSSLLGPALSSLMVKLGLQTAATSTATTAQVGLNASMLANPIGIVIIAITALIGVGVLLYKNLDSVREAVDKVWQFMQTAWDAILGIVSGVFNWVKNNWPLLLGILTGPIGLAVLAITTHWDTIKNAFTAVKDWISDRIGDIVGFITGIPGRIAGVASTMWDGIKNAFTGVKNWISDRLADIVGYFVALPGRFASGVGNIFGFLSESFKSAINFIIRGWNRLEFKIPGFKVGPVGFDGFTLGVPDIPYLASGGPINGLAIVGERGPELFAGQGTIIPNHRLTGGGTTIIQVVVDGQVITESVHRGLLDKQSRSGNLGFEAA